MANTAAIAPTHDINIHGPSMEHDSDSPDPVYSRALGTPHSGFTSLATPSRSEPSTP